MADKHKLSFTAAEIDERLRTAGEAVLYTPQTLTPEQQAQARKNIGVTNTSSKPIAYLYNGVELPPIPDDIAGYSHIVIFRTDLTNDSGNYYRVFGTNAQMRTFEGGGLLPTTYHGSVDTAEFREGSAYPNYTEWTVANSTGTDGFNNYLHMVVWANYDVPDLDGKVYLAASEPVPVYPEGGGGADWSPVLIDLDTYGGGTLETSVTAVILDLLIDGGGEATDVPMGNLFSDLSTERPIRARFSFPYDDVSDPVQVTLDSVATIRRGNQVFELYLNAQFAGGETVSSVLVYINADGRVRLNLLIPGADTTAIAADMEAILNAEY